MTTPSLHKEILNEFTEVHRVDWGPRKGLVLTVKLLNIKEVCVPEDDALLERVMVSLEKKGWRLYDAATENWDRNLARWYFLDDI